MEWVDIPNFEMYQVCKEGLIRSKRRNLILSPRVSRTGYNHICFTIKCKRYYMYAHRIVAEVFIPKVEGKDFVNHKDGNKLNNHMDNLEWVTRSENMKHAYLTGLNPPPPNPKYNPNHYNYRK